MKRSGPNNKFEKSDEISLEDFLLVIIKKTRFILSITFFSGIISIFYVTFIAETIFSSSSQIMSSSKNSKSSNSSLAAQFGIVLPNTGLGQKWVYPEVIKSTPLMRNVLHKNHFLKSLNAEISLFNLYFNEEQVKKNGVDVLNVIGVEKLLSNLDISEDLVTKILTLKVFSSDSELSVKINNSIIEELDAHQKDYNRKQSTKTKNFILKRINETRAELEEAEEKLKTFNERNKRIEKSAGLQLERQRLQREASVLTGVYTTLKQQFETAKIEEVKDADYVVILNPPSFPIFADEPQKKKIVLLTLVLGCILSILLFVILEFYGDLLQSKKIKSEIKKQFRYFMLTFKN
jgi:uncharacterized protein involved in exopolysaccharide biosynthesis